jgi:hypothetical protein
MPAFSNIAVDTTFQSVTYSPSTSHKRTADEAQLPESDPYSAISPSATRSSGSYNQIHGFSGGSGPDLANQGSYSRPQHNFNSVYPADTASFETFINPQQALPNLEIPSQSYYPGLSNTHENSPWGCSSASDSTYSTQSERSGHWSGPRGRRGSNGPEWPGGVPQFSSPSHGIIGTPQNNRFDSSMLVEPYENEYPPQQLTPPMAPRHLDVPNNNNSFVAYYMEPVVGTPALTTYDKPLAQLFPATTPGVSSSGLGGIEHQKVEPPHHFGALSIASDITASYPMQSSKQDVYIESYWKSFHVLFPIVHQGTFDPTANDLLTNAIAAIGTQYHDSAEARKEGMEMNEYCKKSIDHVSVFSSSFLVENSILEPSLMKVSHSNFNISFQSGIFTPCKRFCSLKYLHVSEVERLPFGSLNISRRSIRGYVNQCLCLNLANIIQLVTDPHHARSPFLSHAQPLSRPTDQFTSHPSTPQHRVHNPSLHQEWLDWIDSEARNRLLCFCFVFDVYQSLLQEQSRSKAHLEERNPRMYLPCADNLWSATEAQQWKLQQNDYTLQVHPLALIEQDLSGQYVVSRSIFSKVIHICSLATRLPERENRYPIDYHQDNLPNSVTNLTNIFPTSQLVHSFLSIYYTPLHDLLAIAGDTWVFARKIPQPAAFHAAQSRLKIWSSTPAAAAATHHACNYLSSALSQPYAPFSASQIQSFAGEPFCISDYWSLYTSALICWAFGHHRQQSFPSVSRSSSTTAINTSEMDIDSPNTPVVDEDRVKALTYVNGMLELNIEELLTHRASMRGDTAGVIDSVRLRLEQIGVGGKCMTIVDAIDVLKKLNAGGRARFF